MTISIAEKQESQARVAHVIVMKIKGASNREICEYAAKPPWQISERQTYNYIRKANLWFAKNAERNIRAELGKALERLDGLYQSCLKIQDYKAALATQKEIHALLGMYPAAKVEHSGKIDFLSACVAADAAFQASRKPGGDADA